MKARQDTLIHKDSQLKKVKQALAESEERFALAQRAAHIGTFDWNVKNGDFICTPQLEALYGLPPGGLECKFEGWLRVIHPDDRLRAESEVRAAINGETLDTELRIVRPDGHTRSCL